jgi:hypothetical protein
MIFCRQVERTQTNFSAA